MWFVHFIMWMAWLGRLCQEHKMQIQIKQLQKTKPAKRHHDTHNAFLVMFWVLTGQKGNYEESGSSMFSYRATFQHLYLLLLGDIPANVYGSPQSNRKLANSVQHSTGIITVTFCVLKSHDYERGIRGGKRKVNLMPMEGEMSEKCPAAKTYSLRTFAALVFIGFVKLGMIYNIWKAIKSFCLFIFGLWCGEANSIHSPNIKDFFSLRGSSSVAVTKPKSFGCSLCYPVSILLVNLGFFIVKFMKI